MMPARADRVRPALRRLPIVLAVVVTSVIAASRVAVARGGETTPGPAESCQGVKVQGDPLTDVAVAPALAPFDPDELSQAVAVSGGPLPELTSAIAQGTEADPARCTVAPVITGYDFDGQPVEIDAIANGPTLIVASAHWCGHCDAEIDELLAWERSGELPADLDIVAVNSSLQPDQPNFPPDEWLESRGWLWPVLADSSDEDARRALGVTSYPSLVLVDERGLVRWRVSGVTDAGTIAAAVDDVVTGSAP